MRRRAMDPRHDGAGDGKKFRKDGHRSHVAGLRRLLSGKDKDAIKDRLVREAAEIEKRIRRQAR